MTATGGSIAVDPGLLTVKVDVAFSDGTRPAVYNSATKNATTSLTVPVEIEAATTFYVNDNGNYVVTVSEAGTVACSGVYTVTGGSETSIDVATEIVTPGSAIDDPASASYTAVTGTSATASDTPASGEFNAVVDDVAALIEAVNAVESDFDALRTTVTDVLAALREQNVITESG